VGQHWADCDALPEFRRAFAEAYPWAQARGYCLRLFRSVLLSSIRI